MADPNAFAKLVPGFDFLQGLMKNASAAMPNIGQWIAPTLDPQELDKRIEELRTVQFWLEQNARMLAATIQALEVQRMTLSTLRSMNVSVGNLADALKANVPDLGSLAPAAPAPVPERPAPPPPAAKPLPATDAAAPAEPPAEAAPPAATVDPMQWWGALTRQFTELASHAMKETAADAARTFAGAMHTAAPPAAAGDANSAAPADAAQARKEPAARKKPAARKAPAKPAGEPGRKA